MRRAQRCRFLLGVAHIGLCMALGTSIASASDDCSAWNARNTQVQTACRLEQGTLLKGTLNGCTVYECRMGGAATTSAPRTTSAWTTSSVKSKSQSVANCSRWEAPNASIKAWCAQVKGTLLKSTSNGCSVYECDDSKTATTSSVTKSKSKSVNNCSWLEEENASTKAWCAEVKGKLLKSTMEGCSVYECDDSRPATTSSSVKSKSQSMSKCAGWDAENASIKAWCMEVKGRLLKGTLEGCTVYECDESRPATTSSSVKSKSQSMSKCSQWDAENIAVRTWCVQVKGTLIKNTVEGCSVYECEQRESTSSAVSCQQQDALNLKIRTECAQGGGKLQESRINGCITFQCAMPDVDCPGSEQRNEQMRGLCRQTQGTLIRNVRNGCVVLECATQNASTSSATTSSISRSPVIRSSPPSTSQSESPCAQWAAQNAEVQAVCPGMTLTTTVGRCEVLQCRRGMATSTSRTSSSLGGSAASCAMSIVHGCRVFTCADGRTRTICAGG